MQTEFARAQMITQQIRAWDVLDERVLDAMRRTPREFFVPERYAELAFADTGIPLLAGQHMLAPKIVGRLLQALDAQPGMRALVVGAGTGYVPACLSAMGASVRAIEIHAELAAAARANLKRAGFGQVEVVTGDTFNLDMGKDYALIAVCGALPLYDEIVLLARLAVGGRLFVVTGDGLPQEALLVTRTSETAWSSLGLFETAIDALENAKRPAAFSVLATHLEIHDPRNFGRRTQGTARPGGKSAGPGRARRLGTATCSHSRRRTCAYEPGSGDVWESFRETRRRSSCATQAEGPCGWRIFWRARDLPTLPTSPEAFLPGVRPWMQPYRSTETSKFVQDHCLDPRGR